MRFHFEIPLRAIRCCLAAVSITAKALKSDMPSVAKVLLANFSVGCELTNLSARSLPPQIGIKGAVSDHNIKHANIFYQRYFIISAWQGHTIPVPTISVCTCTNSHKKTETPKVKKRIRIPLF